MKQHLNLLPVVLQKQYLLRTFKRTWVRLALMSCLSGALMYLWLSEQHSEACHELARMEEIVHPITFLDNTNQQLTLATNALEKELQAVAELEQAEVPLSVIGLIGKCFRAVDRPIYLDSLRVDMLSPPVPDPAKKAVATNNIRIMLTGTAFDDAAISLVMMQLRASGVFQSVELEASQATSQAASSTAEDRRNFQIRCQI